MKKGFLVSSAVLGISVVSNMFAWKKLVELIEDHKSLKREVKHLKDDQESMYSDFMTSSRVGQEFARFE